ncbi:MAG: response regulator [Rickettsiales bacterium]|nr:response regulator [Rickettsiales bacterium]
MAQILIAEDDSSMRDFLTLALNKAGHQTTACEDGLQALGALAKQKYDLLLADIVMPGMDGVELATRAKSVDDSLKIMFITGFAAVAMGERNPLRGETKILSKPFHLKELVDQVDKMLAA